MNLFTAFSGDSAGQLFKFLLVLTLKTTTLLLIVQAVLSLMRRSPAALRHWLLTLTLAGALVMPILSSFSPSWSLAVLPEAPEPIPSKAFISPAKRALMVKPTYSSAPPSVKDKPSLMDDVAAGVKKAIADTVPTTPKPDVKPIVSSPKSPAAIWLLIWLAGALVMLTRWLVQFVQVWRITHMGDPADPTWMNSLYAQARFLNIRRPLRLVFSDQVEIPMTWGVWQPVILLPSEAHEWDESRRRVVLLHELAHITRGDYLTQWLVLFNCALYWFHPLMWKTARQMTLEREQASDDLVLSAGVHSVDYAGHLLDIARKAINRPAFQMIGLAMAGRSDLEGRIRGILNTRKKRHSPRRTRSVALLGLIALLLPLGGMQLSRSAAQDNSTILTIVGTGLGDLSGVLPDFENAHPGVTVKVIQSNINVPEAADGLDAHFEAMQNYANSADVLFFAGGSLSLTPFDTCAGYVLDLTPLIKADASFQQDDFYPPMWSTFQWDNGIWGIPTGADIQVLAYNTAAFDQAGLAYPNGSWTLNDFVGAATNLTVKDANGNVTSPGFAAPAPFERELFWRSLMDSDAVDASAFPNAPQFARADIENVVGTYHDLEQQGIVSDDISRAAMYVTSPIKGVGTGYDWTLLPGNRTALLPFGYAISAGTHQPELAYELVKFLSERPELVIGLPARHSTTDPNGISAQYPTDHQELVEQGFANGVVYSNLRFLDYVNAAWGFAGDASLPAHDALQAAEAKTVGDLQTADSKHGTLALAVNPPGAAPALADGKIALNFDMVSFLRTGLPNQDQWDRVIKDFTSSDPQVGAINWTVDRPSAQDAALNSDCFYYPENAVSTLVAGNRVLPLDPLMNADPSFDRADFIGNVLAGVQLGDNTYAMPIDLEPFIMRYDSKKFKAANLPQPADYTWTVQQFNDALMALKPNTQGQAPFLDNGWYETYLALVASYGGLPIDYRTNPPTVNFTDPATVAAIQQVLDLARNGYLDYTPVGELTSGNMPPEITDRTSIYSDRLNGWFREIPEGAPNQPVLFPVGEQYTGFVYDMGAAFISATSQNAEACYRFIQTIAQHPELFSTMPARRSMLANPAFQAATNPDTLALYNQVDQVLSDPHTVPFQIFGNRFNLSDFLIQYWLLHAFDTYVADGGDLNAPLADAQQKAQEFQKCTQNLPPIELGGGGDNSPVTTYLDCAKRVDNSLTAFLDQQFGS